MSPTPTTSVVPLASLILRVRRLVRDAPFEDYITAAITNTATSMSVNDPSKWAVGNVAEFPDGEQVLLRSGGANPLTIKRGHNETTAAAHGANDVILKDPRFPYIEIDEAIRRVVDSELRVWVWKRAITTITADNVPPYNDYYAVPDNFIDVISLTQKVATGGDVVFRDLWYERKTGLPTVDFANNTALYIPTWWDRAAPATLVYRARITTADVEEGEMADAVVLLAAARLLEREAIRRLGADLSRGAQFIQREEHLSQAQTWRRQAYDKLRALRHQLYASGYGPARRWVR